MQKIRCMFYVNTGHWEVSTQPLRMVRMYPHQTKIQGSDERPSINSNQSNRPFSLGLWNQFCRPLLPSRKKIIFKNNPKNTLNVSKIYLTLSILSLKFGFSFFDFSRNYTKFLLKGLKFLPEVKFITNFFEIFQKVTASSHQVSKIFKKLLQNFSVLQNLGYRKFPSSLKNFQKITAKFFRPPKLLLSLVHVFSRFLQNFFSINSKLPSQFHQSSYKKIENFSEIFQKFRDDILQNNFKISQEFSKEFFKKMYVKYSKFK